MRKTDSRARVVRVRGAFALIAALGAIGCTLDYDQFTVGESGVATGTGGIPVSTTGTATGSVSTGGVGGKGGSGGKAVASSASSAGGMSGAGGMGGMTGSGGKGQGGMGGGSSCQPDEKTCGGVCVKIADPTFGCGSQGCAGCAVANASAVCESGACNIGACNAGFANCDGLASNGCEAEPSVDPNNCGGCGSACAVPNATAACVASKCVVAQCNAGFKDCNAQPADGCETNVDGDPSHCGTCVTKCMPVSQICQGGSCVANPCPAGLGDCDGNVGNGCETNLGSSTTSCGFCGNVCNLAHANPKCMGGMCEIATCVGTFADCDGIAANGCEVDLSTSTAHCGNCGIKCPAVVQNGTPTCAVGVCAIACNGGFADCDKKLADGCEISTLTDPSNCGGCGAPCTVENDTPSCTAGMCKVGACTVGFADCDNNPANGCESSLGSPMACGSCNDVCPVPTNAMATCLGGTCGFTCNAGFADCDGDAANGCEASLSDPAHCGGCLNACSVSNGVAGCLNGACTIASCTPPHEDCDGIVGDGCESDSSSNPLHCGSCGIACTVANGVGACAAGACTVGSCSMGFADCDKKYANGCESVNATDPANCGGCGTACPAPPNATPGCALGMCGIGACSPLFGDCNGKLADGCEMSLATDVANCGGCNRACSGINVSSVDCKAGLCDSTCNGSFGNCSEPVAPAADDGCELDVSQNQTHCGSCSNSCATQGSPPANAFVCDGGNRPKNTCGCSSNAACGPGATCNNNSGICTCGANGACKQGEACNAGVCSCDGGAACANGQTCCSPGCKGLDSDPQNCGACGHVCPDNFVCNNGSCQCNDNSDCLQGGSFCSAFGACHCSGQAFPCGGGQRCLANGSCG